MTKTFYSDIECVQGKHPGSYSADCLDNYPDTAVYAKNLTKIYRLYRKPKERLYETFHPLRKKYHRDFHALNDVSFEIKKGETVGVVGKNGSGKSTLLQILTGVLTPTSGSVLVNGRVSALLELGAGFNPQFTGIENVFFQGALMGFTKEEMNSKIDEILSFADIGEYVNQPVRTYSSGMYVRLAFAVAIMVEPDIFIVDEALAVGDILFQFKCMRYMQQMIDRGITLIFVSHDLLAIKRITKKALWLNGGILEDFSDSNSISEKYLSHINNENLRLKSNSNQNPAGTEISMEFLWGAHRRRFGTGEALIEKVLLNSVRLSSDRVIQLNTLDPLSLEIHIKVIEPDVKKMNASIVFFDSNGLYCSGMATHYDGIIITADKKTIVCNINYFGLLRGLYSISISLWDQFIRIPYDVQERMYDVNVFSPNIRDEGFIYLSHSWK